MRFVIKVGSITNAQHGIKVLRKHGYKPNLNRIKNLQPSDGCGYVINLTADDKNKVINLLKINNVRILGVEDL